MKTLAIAVMTFREILSRRVQVNLLIFGVVLLGTTFFASSLTIGFANRILVDFGLSGMELVSVLLAGFLGADLVAGDVQRRVLYPIIAKPVSRRSYLIGRYLGLAFALAGNLLVMSAILCALLVFDARAAAALSPQLFAAIGLLLLKALTVAAVATFFSTFTGTTLAAIFTLALTIAGYLTAELRSLWAGGGAWIASLVWRMLPDLGSLTVNDAVIYRSALPAGLTLSACAAALYTLAALALAAAVLERRDFK